MSAPIRHTMLVANAGSGKTYALTTRMVKLLALGVEPRKIAALTFTKKAAGEFLDAVFLRIAEAALNEKKLAKLNEDLNAEKGEGSVPPLDAPRCRDLLAKCRDLPRVGGRRGVPRSGKTDREEEGREGGFPDAPAVGEGFSREVPPEA